MATSKLLSFMKILKPDSVYHHYPVSFLVGLSVFGMATMGGFTLYCIKRNPDITIRFAEDTPRNAQTSDENYGPELVRVADIRRPPVRLLHDGTIEYLDEKPIKKP